MKLIVCRDAEALAEEAARRVVEVVGQGGRLALSGGSTPRRLHHFLVERSEAIAWSKLELFWGDEREDASNLAMARETLIDHVPIPAENVHRIEVDRGAMDAAAHYRDVIGTEPLDLVLLGMGGDGHCASLFPETPDLASLQGVVVTESPKPPPVRVSLALDVINRARQVLLLVAGEAKRARLAEAHRQWHAGGGELPVSLVRPTELTWVVDESAAASIGKGGGDE